MNIFIKVVFFLLLLNIVLSIISNRKKDKVYGLHHCDSIKVDIPNIIFKNTTPKIIHQCWIGDLNYLKYFEKCIENTRKCLPEYQYILWTEDRILSFLEEKYSKRILDAFLSIDNNYIPAKADFFRYLVIYYYGGVYLDIKSSFNKNVSHFIENYGNKLIVSHWYDYPFGVLPFHHLNNFYNSHLTKNNYGEFQNFYIISPPGNPILKKCIEKVVSNIEYGSIHNNLYNDGKKSVLLLSGPIMYSNVIQKYYNKKYVNIVKRNMNHNIISYYVNHKKILGSFHYSKQKNKKILKTNTFKF